MTILIIDNWAHRTRNDGMMESAPLLGGPMAVVQEDGWTAGLIIDAEHFAIHQPAEMGLTGGEYSVIHQTVKRVADLFPEGRPALPTSETPQRTQANPEAVR